MIQDKHLFFLPAKKPSSAVQAKYFSICRVMEWSALLTQLKDAMYQTAFMFYLLYLYLSISLI